ncbi:hypothetical protein FSARC_1883 [Fusarium sarcochroum]|uniref:DUF3295 domain-containing protein n=1 Tax=Fusarium sarcochroum TaxID=1208366 RepID=A0A8H4U7L2_9HYPO|nr:hypothetical protein FSARC_1883 [Fusarium sarcochroum]
MFSLLDTPPLTVDTAVIGTFGVYIPVKVDATSAESAHPTDSVEKDEKLESVDWRLWQRRPIDSQTPSHNIQPETTMTNLPQLSDSFESPVNEDAPNSISIPAIQIHHQYPWARIQSWRGSRSSPRDMKTSNILLADDKCPPPASRLAALAYNESPYTPLVSERHSHTMNQLRLVGKAIATTRGCPKPPPQILRHTQVVRGFWSSQQCPDETAPAANTAFEPKPLPTAITTRPKEAAKFVFGGSPSSYEHEIGLGNVDSVSPTSRTASPHMRDATGRSGTLTNVITRSGPSSLVNVRDEHTSPIIDARVGTTENEAVANLNIDDCIDEHAIDDDDDYSIWEDIPEKNDETFFCGDDALQQDDFDPNPASQISLLTLLLAQHAPGRRRGSHALRSPPNASASFTTHNASLHTLSERRDKSRPKKKCTQSPRLESTGQKASWSATRHTMTDQDHIRRQDTQLPHTIRRNVMKEERTKVLPPRTLHERQVESSTMDAVDKRRGSSDNGVIQKQCSEDPCIEANEDQRFVKHCVNDYHTRGW